MDLSLTDEQVMLRDTVAAFLAERYSFEARRGALSKSPYWRPDIWRSFAQELGILGAALPETLGGLGGGAIENMVLMEEFGRALVVEPYLSTVVIGGGFLHLAEHVQAQALGKGIVSGEVVLAFAQAEQNSRFSLSTVQTRARADGRGWAIDGRKRLVLAAPYASHFIVTARTSGGLREADGVSVFIVEAAAAGLVTHNYMTYDGFYAADVTFENVRVGGDALIGDKDGGVALSETVLGAAKAALCAEGVGLLREMLDRTLAYTKERKQFGVPISSFQALQHRMADMYIDAEQARSMACLAAIRAGEADGPRRRKAIASAKAQIGEACRKVGQSAIQLHGGMGMTEEMAISHYFKRATVIETMFGSVDHHLAEIESLGEVEAL